MKSLWNVGVHAFSGGDGPTDAANKRRVPATSNSASCFAVRCPRWRVLGACVRGAGVKMQSGPRVALKCNPNKIPPRKVDFRHKWACTASPRVAPTCAPRATRHPLAGPRADFSSSTAPLWTLHTYPTIAARPAASAGRARRPDHHHLLGSHPAAGEGGWKPRPRAWQPH
jgi:hypothetical protein